MKLNKKIQVRLTDNDFKEIEKEAKDRGVSVSIIIRERLKGNDNTINKDDTKALLEALTPTLKKLVDYDKE